MPIAYGQVKGRKYNNVQPTVDGPGPVVKRKSRKQSSKNIELVQCKSCGINKPPAMFQSGMKICKQCQKRRTNG